MTVVARSPIDLTFLMNDADSAGPVWVRDLRLDSRQVCPGDAFFAVKGATSHGLSHVGSAIARGATVIVYDPADGSMDAVPSSVRVLPVEHLGLKLGDIADRAYGNPSASLEVVGITGTNGKTTCAWLYAICRDASAAYLGTIGAGRPPKLKATTHTTGDVFTVHRLLASFVDAGASHASMEVSSHALDQNRIDSVRMPIVAFTNLTRDHLDYHGTMENYAAAKEKIFRGRDVQIAVINVDDPVGRDMVGRLPAHIHAMPISLSPREWDKGFFVYASTVDCHQDGIRIGGRSHHGDFELSTRLVGRFNAENLLIVFGLLLASGMSNELASAALGRAVPPPGRMEAFVGAGPLLVVDYAHTPDALEKALLALRLHVRGKLYCVFGCGGDRDTGKRSAMAKVAEKCADQIIVTDDNPRTEDPEKIIQMIFDGFRNKHAVIVERDRRRAIKTAAERAQSGDIVLIAGKGHEDYQIYGNDIRHYSDREVAAELARQAA